MLLHARQTKEQFIRYDLRTTKRFFLSSTRPTQKKKVSERSTLCPFRPLRQLLRREEEWASKG